MSALFPCSPKPLFRGIGRSAKVETVWCGRQRDGRVMSLNTFKEAERLRFIVLSHESAVSFLDGSITFAMVASLKAL